ncbi:MAG TPA: zinc ribbon domain-containing protein [Pyrinomonadaceae bacterium]|nr:zinc ribbon domain-containing protein [Pyrinomonadaceae bacterium]
MFCPRCGQQQASEEVRFCSRCGLRLDALAEFVESGGSLDAADATEDLPVLTPRQRGTRKGVLILIAGLIFSFVAVMLTGLNSNFAVLLVLASLVVIYGVLRILYGMLLEDDAARKKAEKRAARGADRQMRRGKNRDKFVEALARAAELPPQRSVPAGIFTKAGSVTGEMSAPPSVTENTTRLLEEEDDGPHLNNGSARK